MSGNCKKLNINNLKALGARDLRERAVIFPHILALAHKAETRFTEKNNSKTAHTGLYSIPKEPLQRAITHHNIYIGDQFLYSQTELRHMEVYFSTTGET